MVDVTAWRCPVCHEPRGLALQLLGTPERYAAEHAGVLPDAAELAGWQLGVVRAAVEGCVLSHSDAERAELAATR